MNSPSEIAKNYINIGINKVNLPFFKMVILGILSGIFIALAGIGATAASVSIESASVAKLVSALIFPAALSMVIIMGSELFTGNNLLVIPLAAGKIKFSGMIKNWVIVYTANFIGSVIIAALAVYGHTFDLFMGSSSDGLAGAAVSLAVSKVSMSFGDGFIRGILCNFLVCTAIWMSFAGKSVASKVMGLFFPIMLFVVSGFEHSIANMYYLSAGIFASAEYGIAAEGLTWGSLLFKNLLPVTLGNIVGGVSMGLSCWVLYLREKKEK